MSIHDVLRLRNAGRLDEARAELKRHLRVSPTDADATHLLGMIAFQQRDVHEAHRWMLRSTHLAPSKAMFRINLAAVLGDLKRPREAIEQLKVGASLPGG